MSVRLRNTLLVLLPVAALASVADAQQNPPAQGDGVEVDIGLGDANIGEIEVASLERQTFDKAQSQMAAEDYKNAAVAFHGLLSNVKAKEFHEQSEYLLAKSLYRLGYYHSSLSRFTGLLNKGDKHKYFKTSKEWLFFISRKTADQGVVLEEIARYSEDSIPDKYADEFHFLLARLYFRKATEEQFKQQEVQEEQPAEEEKPAEERPTEEKKDKPAEDGDMDFGTDDLGGGGDVPGSGGDDDFDFGLDDLDDKPKKKKDEKKPAEPAKGKAAPAPKPAETTKPEAAKPNIQPSFKDVMEDKKPAAEEEKKPERKALVADNKEALQKCVEHTKAVKEASPLYLKAVYLKAVCFYEMEKFEDSVSAFKEVVKLTNPKNGRFKNPALREEAFFSLARTHYRFQQFRAAIFYYNKVSRDSQGWLDALFESSWAYFRLADYEKALGNLITLHSPFFSNEYFPESLILKAVTYYENCRYPEALAILDEFEAQYGPLRDELDRLTKDAKTPEDYYKLLKDLEKKGASSSLTQRLVKLARSDRALNLLAASAAELEAEEKKIANAPAPLKDSPLAAEMLEGVRKRREELTNAAGALARAKLEAERDELKSQSSQLYRIKFEVTKREKEGLEATLRGEKQEVTLGKYRFTTAVSDEHLYWPFDGEYWRDELGTYEYTLAKGCRQ
ncbi:MAG: hypothetical protein AB2A00_37105 [Myxococcota bacterium]